MLAQETRSSFLQPNLLITVGPSGTVGLNNIVICHRLWSTSNISSHGGIVIVELMAVIVVVIVVGVVEVAAATAAEAFTIQV